MNRDQHLPPPAVADWLLDQGWSGVIPVTAIAYPKGHPDGLSKSERFDYCSATVAIGADECCHLTLPAEALGALESDRQARLDAIERKRAALILDELERKRERNTKRMDEGPLLSPPAEGEVAEFITQLKSYAEYGMPIRLIPFVVDRAITMLQGLSAAAPAVVPIPVSEGPWELEGWCDAEGRCWCLSILDGSPPRWWLVRPEPLSHGFLLPATALPLPQQETPND